MRAQTDNGMMQGPDASGPAPKTAVRKRSGLWLVALALVALAVAPTVLPLSRIYLLTDVLIFGLFAVSYNILLGHSGLLSFGHSAYFGLGAYGTALLLRFHPEVPVVLAFLLGVLAAMAGGLVIGYFAVRRGGPYFAMLTLAFGLMLYTAAWQWRALTAGDDGFGGFMPGDVTLAGVTLLSFADVRQTYWLVLGVVASCLLGIWLLLTRTPFGNSVSAIKQNQERATFFGYNVFVIKLITYTFAATIAGIAGGLFVLFRDFVSPGVIDLALATDVVLMTFIGGMYSFLGPMVGAAFYTIAGDYLASYTDRWELIMGLIFIALVLFEPRGLVGVMERLIRLFSPGRRMPRDREA